MGFEDEKHQIIVMNELTQNLSEALSLCVSLSVHCLSLYCVSICLLLYLFVLVYPLLKDDLLVSFVSFSTQILYFGRMKNIVIKLPSLLMIVLL